MKLWFLLLVLCESATVRRNVTCTGPQYQFDGVNSADITMNANDLLQFVFSDSSCSPTYPLTIQGNGVTLTAGDGVTGNTAAVGTISFQTNYSIYSSASSNFTFVCLTQLTMTGNIIISPVASVGTDGPAAATSTGTTIGLSWGTPSSGADNSCVFGSWQVHDVGNNQVVPGCGAISPRTTMTCTVSSLTENSSYIFAVRKVCSNVVGLSSYSNNVSLATRDAARKPVNVTAVNATSTTAVVSWAAGAQGACSFTSWSVTNGSAAYAGCTGLTNFTTQTCTATGLLPGMNYSFFVTEVCASSPNFDSQISTPSLRIQTVVPESAPIAVQAFVWGSTQLNVVWNPGSRSADCTFAWWDVRVVSPAAQAGIPTGCAPVSLTNYSYNSCNATNLLANTNYTFAVTATCANPAANSAPTTSVPLATLPAPASPPTGVTATNVTAETVDLSWTPGAPNGCTFFRYVVLFSVGPPGAVGAAPSGCTSLTTPNATSCRAIGLLWNASFAFTVQTQCTISLFDSVPSASSNTIFTKEKHGVNIECNGTSDFSVEGYPDPNIYISAGDTLVFFIQPSCSVPPAKPFEIRAGNQLYTIGLTGNGLSSGNITLETTLLTPGLLTYSSPGTSMMGYIVVGGGVVTKSTSPIPPTITSAADPTSSMVITWTANTAGDCVFSNWNIKFVTGGNGSVNGCLAAGMRNRGTTTCTATGLSQGTSYAVTVEEACQNPDANSGASGPSNSYTTAVPPPPTPVVYFWGLQGLPQEFEIWYYVAIAAMAAIILGVCICFSRWCYRRFGTRKHKKPDRPDFGSEFELNG